VLEDANLKLSSVASDILGASGRAIIHRQEHPKWLADKAVSTLRNRRFPFGFVAQPGTFHFHLPVRQLHAAGLEPMTTDLAAHFTWRRRPSNLLGAQDQDPLDYLRASLVDHGLHHMAGALDEVGNGKQDLSVALTELLENGRALARGPGHDVVRFLHGGRLLSVICVWQPDSIESAPTAAYPDSVT